MENFIEKVAQWGFVIVFWLLLMMFLFSCSSSSRIYERSPDGKVYTTKRPECIDNW